MLVCDPPGREEGEGRMDECMDAMDDELRFDGGKEAIYSCEVLRRRRGQGCVHY